MKKLIYIIGIIGLILFTNSCEEDKPAPCTGSLTFSNISLNPYYLYVNGELKGIVNNVLTLKEMPTGVYTIRVVQESGYLLTPTEKTYTGTLDCAGSLNTVFP
ncbi:MAG: hypothetical protein PHX80_05360 [Candidatus Nanoarchaeia archaeon]|nr:hypothetical protein [Candidatus Nanoarchaeia archaeon]